MAKEKKFQDGKRRRMSRGAKRNRTGSNWRNFLPLPLNGSLLSSGELSDAQGVALRVFHSVTEQCFPSSGWICARADELILSGYVVHALNCIENLFSEKDPDCITCNRCRLVRAEMGDFFAPVLAQIRPISDCPAAF